MQEDANSKCETCHGEGEVYAHFVNHEHRYVIFEWLYCNQCFDSFGSWPNLDEIDGKEFDRLLEEEGYSDHTGY